MSSTQMDFSPTIIDRKQDITSWPEGEIASLTTRDQNRYQRRKEAIKEYFQSELSVEEISSRHRLAQSDSLATLLWRCCMRHEDGRLWGFRALVPGVRVVDHSAPARTDSFETQEGQGERSVENHLQDELDDDDATAERPAIKLTASTLLPETPLPEGEGESATELESLEKETGVEDLTDEPEAASQGVEEENSEEEVEQEDFPVIEIKEVTEQEEDSEAVSATNEPSTAEESEADEAEVNEEEAETAEPAQEDGEEEQVADLDTVEVAKVEAEERRGRVAEADTIVVPAAMLDALEKADRAAEVSEAETVETSIVSAHERVNGHRALTPVEQTELIGAADQEFTLSDGTPTQSLADQRRDIRQLNTADLKTPTQSLVEESRYRVTGSQAALKRSVLRRWGKQVRVRQQKRWVKIVSAAVIATVLVGLAIPLIVGMMGYSTYNNIKGVATDGVDNLLAIKNLIPADKNDLTSVLNTQKLTEAQTSLSKAQSDFLQLQDMVNRPDVQSLLQQFAPQYSGKLDMARRLVQVALDVSRMGQELIGVAQMGANILHGGSLLSSSSNKPLLTADDVNAIEAALVHAQYYISDIQTQMSQVNLAQVPFGSAAQKAELAKYLGEIPQAQSTITQVQSLVGPVAWLLGVGSPRNFLVQTLDRGELRPSGGFEGQYGVLSINNGRLGPITLHDIATLDYGNDGNELGNHPPEQYKWMDFGNFGVRDANLSADFPTTAKMVMQLFQLEGGGPVDGDIQFTPVVIEQLLQMTGPLYVKEYNETITAQNLEDKLHLYQQNYSYINIEAAKTGAYNHQTRKAFTSLVGQLLLDRAKHLSTTQLMSFAKILFKDFKSRDLQIYFNNPVVEQWLTTNGDSGAMPQFINGTDGFMVVQANISISKATQFVHSTFNDQVTLNSDGSATHTLTITLKYDQTGPVYGYDTYSDYMRVYAPANAQFNYGYGFDSGHALCTPGGKDTSGSGNGGGGTGGGNGGGGNGGGGNGGGGTGTGTGKTTGCTQYNSYFPNENARYCSNGVYTLGMDGMVGKAYPIDSLSGPTATTSDLPGYQMWGGLTLTPKNCTSTITLQWTVPHIVQNKAGQPPYQMIVGHQAGWPDTAQVSIDASALKGIKNLSFNQTIDDDTLIALPARPLPPSQKKPTTPTPAVTPTATKKS